MPPGDYEGRPRYQEIAARVPQVFTSASPTQQTPSSTIANTSPLSSDPSTTTPAQASHVNSKDLRTYIEYFFLIVALFVASILIYRFFYLRRARRESYNRGLRSFNHTAGPPHVNLQGYPGYFLALPLPSAYPNTRTRANDTDFDGRRFTSAGAEVDHDGLLRDKDLLPKYESVGGPPKYTDLELQQVLNVTSSESAPVPPPPPLAAQSPPSNQTIWRPSS